MDALEPALVPEYEVHRSTPRAVRGGPAGVRSPDGLLLDELIG